MRKSKATKTLARKLRDIRLWKGLSQGEILRIVLPEAEATHRALVSQWENAKREPSRLREMFIPDFLIRKSLRQSLYRIPPAWDSFPEHTEEIFHLIPVMPGSLSSFPITSLSNLFITSKEKLLTKNSKLNGS